MLLKLVHKTRKRNFRKMSLFFNTNDGVHIEQLNAEQSRKRGIFINVRPNVDDNGKIQSEHQTPSFIHLRNNLNISPGERRREAFAKTPLKKVRKIKECLGNKGDGEREKKVCHYIHIMQIANNILTEYNF